MKKQSLKVKLEVVSSSQLPIFFVIFLAPLSNLLSLQPPPKELATNE
jgi:hypothetical protein